MKKIPLLLSAMLLAIAACPALATSPVHDSDMVGKPSPPIETVDLEGKPVSLKAFVGEGKATVVNFWGLRCNSCLQEIPSLNLLDEKYGSRVVLLGVNVDAIPAKVLTDQIRKNGIRISYRVVADPEFRLVDSFKMMGAPLTVVIDPQGIVRYLHENYEPGDEKKIEDALARVLSR